MIATAQSAPPAMAKQRYATEEDSRAQFASIQWLEAENRAGRLLAYQRQYVAILGEMIIASDCDSVELNRRIDALGDNIEQFRVVVKYVSGLGDEH